MAKRKVTEVVWCCNEPCPTPFCPHCGKLVNNTANLPGLARHCRNVAGGLRKKLENYKKYPGRCLDEAKRTADAARTEKQLVRWETWEKQLRELLADNKEQT